MHQTTTSSLLVLVGALSACGANSNAPIDDHQAPLSPSSPDAGAIGVPAPAPENCEEVECPPPPADWCSGANPNLPLPAFIIDFWNESCKTETGCGDGILTEAEVCDDGNTQSGDGCAADCGAIEPGFVCSAVGQPCY